MAIASLIAQILGNNAAEKRSEKELSFRETQEEKNRQNALDVEKERAKNQKERDAIQAERDARNKEKEFYRQFGITDEMLAQGDAIYTAAKDSYFAEMAKKKQEAETSKEASRIKNRGQLATEEDVIGKLMKDASMAAGDASFQKKELEDPSFQDARRASFRSSYLKPVVELGRSNTQNVGPGEFVRRPSIDPTIDKIVPPMTGQGMTQGETTKMVNIGGMTFPQTQRTVTPGSINYGSPEFSIRNLPAGAQTAPTPVAVPETLVTKPQGLPSFLQGTNLEAQLLNSLTSREALTNQILRPRTPEEEALIRKRKQEEAAQKGSVRNMIFK